MCAIVGVRISTKIFLTLKKMPFPHNSKTMQPTSMNEGYSGPPIQSACGAACTLPYA